MYVMSSIDWGGLSAIVSLSARYRSQYFSDFKVENPLLIRFKREIIIITFAWLLIMKVTSDKLFISALILIYFYFFSFQLILFLNFY
jgi:hypothetical protein